MNLPMSKPGIIAMLIVVLTACSKCNNRQVIDESPVAITYKLIKSFVINDTTLFYAAVDVDSLVHHMNKKVGYENYDPYSVRRVLFFKCGPFKLPEGQLEAAKNHSFPFSHFELNQIKSNKGVIHATVTWEEIYYQKYNEKYHDPLKRLHVTLYEQQRGVWKIKAIDFPSDSCQ
jgi:hypothetical protein